MLLNDLQDMSDQLISCSGGWRRAEGWKDGTRKRALYVEIRYRSTNQSLSRNMRVYRCDEVNAKLVAASDTCDWGMPRIAI